MIKCAACGQGWLEGCAIEVATNPPRQLPVVLETFEPDVEIRRLVEASRAARDSFAVKRRERLHRLGRWGALAAAMTAPFILAVLFPEAVVRAAPATVGVYSAFGKIVNIYGIRLRHIEMQHIFVSGVPVLAIKGEILNTSSSDRKIPSLRFGLRNDANVEIYSWTLDSGARPLKAGEVNNFVTRVSSPPATAKNLQVRFAHADEIIHE